MALKGYQIQKVKGNGCEIGLHLGCQQGGFRGSGPDLIKAGGALNVHLPPPKTAAP
ncbi:MAG TPA: hypothetical protein PL099_04665 [Thermoclostridium caenicola]|nr:hypothetical protein [Thermoclostridium caenicola]